jgi:putative transposase
VSERLACLVLGQHPSTQRNIAKTPDEEAALIADIMALALQCQSAFKSYHFPSGNSV